MRFVASNPFDNNNTFFELGHFENMLCNSAARSRQLHGGTRRNDGRRGRDVRDRRDDQPHGVPSRSAGRRVIRQSRRRRVCTEPGKQSEAPLHAPVGTAGRNRHPLLDAQLRTSLGNPPECDDGSLRGCLRGAARDRKVELILNGTVLYSREADATPPQPAGFTGVPAGSTVRFDKVVPTTAIPPKTDICLVQDESASFADDISTLNSLTSTSLIPALGATGADYAACVVGFRDFARPDQQWGTGADWVYRGYADVSPGGPAWSQGAAARDRSGSGL